MKSKKLEELSSFNRSAIRASHKNYDGLLASVLQHLPDDWGMELRALHSARNYNALIEWADSTSSTVFQTAAEHRLRIQVASLIRKYPFPSDLVCFDPEKEAIRKFFKSEHTCKRMNQRFRCYRKARSPHENVLSLARSYISYVLGDLKISDVWEQCRFGAGASLGVHGNCTNLARKLLAKVWTVTPGAYYYACASAKDDFHLFELVTYKTNKNGFVCLDPDSFNQGFSERACIVRHNKISFVPKDAKTHRAIATEPLWNGYIQKGIDLLMRKRLKRVGLDLSDQERNQRLARDGSLNWERPDAYCTIDLSSASDSISIELCRFLLPPDWFDFLNSIRSPCYSLNGKVYNYHKFVSMGNGFCFPLETLIFASLCHAASVLEGVPDDFTVYGDDIIVRKPVFDRLVLLLKLCGFKANPKKTFSTGPFRESCGADWFEGKDVRPIILDYKLDSLENMIKFWNSTLRSNVQECMFSEARSFISSLVPRRLFWCRPCKGNPDSAFEVGWDVFMHSPYSRYCVRTQTWTWFEVLKTAKADKKVRAFRGYNLALIAGALRGVDSSNPFSERFTACTKVRLTGASNLDSEFARLYPWMFSRSKRSVLRPLE